MVEGVELSAGRLRMWNSAGVKSLDSDESAMYLTDIFTGTLNLPVVSNNANQDDYRGQRVWSLSGGPLKAGTTFAQGMIRIEMQLDSKQIWNREWMAIGGSLVTIQRVPLYNVANVGWRHVQTHLQYLTLEIQSNELVMVEDHGVKGRTGMQGFGFNLPAATIDFVIAVGGFN